MPGQSTGKRIDRVAQHIDLLPTLLDYLGLDRSGLPDDPRERSNLTESHPIRSEFLEALIQAELNKKGLAAAGEAVLDEETRNSLRALGYLQ